MRKAILILLLIVTTNPAYADWSKTAELENRTIYINHESIRKNKHFVKVWLLQTDATKANLIPSTELLYEYDCKEGRKRVLASIALSGRMGSGKILYEDHESGEWEHIRFHVNNNVNIVYSLVCHGEWLKISEDPKIGTLYIDPSSIRKNGKSVTFWSLLSLTTADLTGVRSVKHHHEFDCKAAMSRILGQTTHSDWMAFGDVVSASLGGTQILELEPIQTEDKHMLSLLCD